jgi:hypothetical protein
VERVAELQGPVEHVDFEQGGVGLLQPLFERLAPDELHDQVGAALLLEKVGDLGDVGMVQVAQQAGLLVEQLAAGGLLDPILGLGAQLLEGPQLAAAGGQLLDLVDPGHTAAAHQADDAIFVPEHSADGQRLCHRPIVSQAMLLVNCADVYAVDQDSPDTKRRMPRPTG